MARIKLVLTERKNAYMQAAHMRRILLRHPERLPELLPKKKTAIAQVGHPKTLKEARKEVIEESITEPVTSGSSGTML